MKKLKYIFAGMLMAVSLSSCVKNIETTLEKGDTNTLDRPLVEISFCPEIETGLTKTVIGDTGEASGKWVPSLNWNSNAVETMSVFIKNSDGVIYAGEISSPASEEASRHFSGSVLAKQDGESYIYMYPSTSSQETSGAQAAGAIDLSSQAGTLSGLSDKIPFVWEETATGAEQKAYVYLVKLVLTFPENPGEISAIKISTMARGARDKVFPKYFKAANLDKGHNATLPDWTEGTSVTGDDFTDVIILNGVEASKSTDTQKVAYFVCSSAEKLNVFSSKFRVTATNSESKTYYGDFRSFPGQGDNTAQETQQLEAFENGKYYRATRVMSPVPPATVINADYKVNSLLGVWNEYGKPYDPDNKVIPAENLGSSNAPQSLKNIIGTTDLQTAFTNQMNKATGAAGTPTFLGKLYKSTGNSTNAGKTIKVTKASKVFVTVVSENAWDRNLLGYYYFPFNTSDEASQPTAENFEKYIVFPDISRPYHVPFNSDGTGTTATPPNIGSSDNAPIKPYSTVQLIYKDSDTGFSSEIFPENTFVGFFVMKQAMVDRGNSMLNWNSQRFFTNYDLSTQNKTLNPFAAGDLIKPEEQVTSYNGEGKLKNLAVFGFRDNAADNMDTAFATMIFLVSTSPESGDDALSMQNTAAFNLSASNETNLVVGRSASHTVTRELAKGITCSNDLTNLDGSVTQYEFTLTIDDPLYGELKDVVVKHGTEVVSPISSTATSEDYKITGISNNITIEAKTTNIVKVKALTASDLNNLAAPGGTTGESNYKLILHNLSTHPSDGASAFDGSGNYISLSKAQCPFWNGGNDYEIVQHSTDGLEVNPLGKYTDYYWTLEKSGDKFLLKNIHGKYLSRGPEAYPNTSWPKVMIQDTGTALSADSAGYSGYDIYLKSSDSDFNCVTSRAGWNAQVPIFFSSGSHVNTYGKWRVYKVWTEVRQ